MSRQTLRVLLVEDSSADAELIQHKLLSNKLACAFRRVETAAKQFLRHHSAIVRIILAFFPDRVILNSVPRTEEGNLFWLASQRRLPLQKTLVKPKRRLGRSVGAGRSFPGTFFWTGGTAASRSVGAVDKTESRAL